MKARSLDGVFGRWAKIASRAFAVIIVILTTTTGPTMVRSEFGRPAVGAELRDGAPIPARRPSAEPARSATLLRGSL